MIMMKSKLGEIKSKEEWQKEIDDFWVFAEAQSRYVCKLTAKSKRKEFRKPVNAFDRYARLLGLEEVTSSYKGVF